MSLFQILLEKFTKKGLFVAIYLTDPLFHFEKKNHDQPIKSDVGWSQRKFLLLKENSGWIPRNTQVACET